MATLKEAAQAYEPEQTMNIADLDVVKINDVEVHTDGKGKDKDGKEFTYNYILKDGVEYRVPNSVLAKIQEMLEINPKVQSIKVEKSGSGLGTKYKVKMID